MDSLNYWLRHGVSRRAMLKGTGLGAGGLAAAALIGCGSNSSTPTATAAAGGATAAATSAASSSAATASAGSSSGGSAGTPKAGGTLKYATNANVDSFDVLTARSYKTSYATAYAYSRLVQYAHGDGGPAPGKVIGDAATSWEQPDKTTFVFHIRPNMKFDSRPPTSGRVLDAQDVLQSWNKFANGSVYRGDLVNSANKDAPVTKVEAVDNQTVKFTLAFPDATFLPVLGWPFDFWIEPVEAFNGGFDPKSEMRGTGPFMLTDYKSDVGYTYKKNPTWYAGPDKPYVDGAQVSIISDQAQVEGQLKAGNLQFGHGLIPTADMPSVVQGTPGTHLVTGSPGAGGNALGLSYQSGEPWTDERVRQAFSMSIDRDAFVNVIYEPSALEKAGAKINTYWNTPLSAGFGTYWLDPKGKDFGQYAKYLQHDVAEAKKLLSAAGYSSSKPVESTLILTPQYYPDWQSRSQTIQSMAAEAGIKLTIYSSDYTSDWVPNYLRAHANYKGPKGGNACGLYPLGARSDPGQWLSVFFQSTGANNIVGTNFPELDTMIQDQRTIFDFQQRVSKIQDIQRYMVQHMVCVPAGPLIDTVDVADTKLHGPDRYEVWPGGLYQYQAGAEIFPYYWLESA